MHRTGLDDSVLFLLDRVRKARPRNIAPVTLLKNYFKTFQKPVELICQNTDAFVFKAQKADGNSIAIKILLEQFSREIQVILLHHESIIHCYNHYVVDQGIFVFEMELCDFNLEEYAQKNHLLLNDIYNIMNELASALHYLHENNYAHRRIHPTNVLIKNQHVKLSNFRMLKIIKKESENTYLTPKTCSAPEQLFFDNKGSRVIYDQCVDIWAFGVVFYWLFTKKYPFDPSIDDLGLIHDILINFGNEIQKLPPPDDIPLDAFKIIQNCLSVNPQRRPSAADLFARVTGLLNHAAPDFDVSSPTEEEMLFDDFEFI